MLNVDKEYQGKRSARFAALIIGLAMFFVPWYVNGPHDVSSTVGFWNCVITGGLIVAVSVVALIRRTDYWPGWVFAVLNLWILLNPETLSFAEKEMSILHIIIGVAGLVVSFIWIRRVFGRLPLNRRVVKGRTFRECSSSERTLFGLVLVVLGLGYVMAIGYLYMTHTGLDGKSGVTVQDLSISYYGNRSGTRLEQMLRGPMSGMRSEEDLNKIVAWLKSGADQAGYDKTIHPIIEKKCARCHSAKSGMNLPDFTTYAGIRAVAKVDTGMSIETLVKLSHIHLFGIGLVTFVLGFVFTFTALPAWLKNIVIVAPFAAVVVDIATWFLTKWDPIFAYTVLVAGSVMGLSWAFQILVSMYQIVFLTDDKQESEPI
ncbi:MAG: hypothetical protein EPN69_10215 [Rhodanobacter sp.]|nr:MAG: hypothetical protein EPN69_10215 [Rhodanobacter sp.]TAM42159.1 MAG: hypothetical protein EPN58_03990 [Rhodanobacter sp.]TAN26760.1 MAG: hypothetical protein EPN32_05860 [Rhodanobacter sp.]